MRLSTSTCIYFNRPGGVKASILDSIRRCGDAGYKVLDMNFHDLSVFNTPFRTGDWQRLMEDAKEIADSYGIEFSQGHSHFYHFCDPNAPEKEFKDERIRQAIEGARILGVKWLVIHAATDFESPTLVKDSKCKTIVYLKPRIELAGKYSVGIALENLWEKNIAPQRRYCTTAEELVDWQEVMDALRIADYQGDFTYEIHNYTANMPEAGIKTALAHSIAIGNHLLSL